MDLKIEVKQEPLFCAVREIKEHVWNETCRVNCVLDSKTEIKDETNEEEFCCEDPVIHFQECKEDSKLVVKEESWWLQGCGKETACNEIKDGTDGSCSTESSRLPTTVTSTSKSLISSNEEFGKTKSIRSDNFDCKAVKNCEHEEIDTTEISPKGNFIPSDELPSEQTDSINSTFKQNNLIHQNNSEEYCVNKKSQAYKSGFFNPESTKAYKCDICEKSFTRLSSLKTHNLIHEDEQPYQCDICEKSFRRLSALKTHNFIHEGNKPHKCDICEKSFSLLTNLKKHVYIHEAVKPYQCDTCHKGFTQLHSLQGHILIHQGVKPHKCDVCNKSFTLLTGLKRHKYVHNDIKPYKCSVCDKGFTLLQSLKAHILLHEGVKSYRCDTCGKGFTRLLSLTRHNLIHEGKRPYSMLSLKRHNLVQQNNYNEKTEDIDSEAM